MEQAHEHHIGHSEYLSWPRDDRLAEQALREHRAGNCPQCGVHRSTWDPAFGGDIRRPAFVPVWRFCRPCKLWQIADKEGPPAGRDAKGDVPAGWHLEWAPASYDDEQSERRVSRG